MSARPTSIEGGIRYPDRGRDGKPLTQAYVVTWRVADGRTRYVQTPPLWVGRPLSGSTATLFFRQLERDLALYPPT